MRRLAAVLAVCVVAAVLAGGASAEPHDWLNGRLQDVDRILADAESYVDAVDSATELDPAKEFPLPPSLLEGASAVLEPASTPPSSDVRSATTGSRVVVEDPEAAATMTSQSGGDLQKEVILAPNAAASAAVAGHGATVLTSATPNKVAGAGGKTPLITPVPLVAPVIEAPGAAAAKAIEKPPKPEVDVEGAVLRALKGATKTAEKHELKDFLGPDADGEEEGADGSVEPKDPAALAIKKALHAMHKAEPVLGRDVLDGHPDEVLKQLLGPKKADEEEKEEQKEQDKEDDEQKAEEVKEDEEREEKLGERMKQLEEKVRQQDEQKKQEQEQEKDSKKEQGGDGVRVGGDDTMSDAERAKVEEEVRRRWKDPEDTHEALEQVFGEDGMLAAAGLSPGGVPKHFYEEGGVAGGTGGIVKGRKRIIMIAALRRLAVAVTRLAALAADLEKRENVLEHRLDPEVRREEMKHDEKYVEALGDVKAAQRENMLQALVRNEVRILLSQLRMKLKQMQDELFGMVRERLFGMQTLMHKEFSDVEETSARLDKLTKENKKKNGKGEDGGEGGYTPEQLQNELNEARILAPLLGKNETLPAGEAEDPAPGGRNGMAPAEKAAAAEESKKAEQLEEHLEEEKEEEKAAERQRKKTDDMAMDELADEDVEAIRAGDGDGDADSDEGAKGKGGEDDDTFFLETAEAILRGQQSVVL